MPSLTRWQVIQTRVLNPLKINQVTPTNISVFLLAAWRKHRAQLETCDVDKLGLYPSLMSLLPSQLDAAAGHHGVYIDSFSLRTKSLGFHGKLLLHHRK